jgi:putative transposase
MVDESVAIYNTERPHFSLQLKTPDEVHRASLAEIRQPVNPATSGVNL